MFDGLQGTGIYVGAISKIPIRFSIWFFVICGLLMVQSATVINGLMFVIALTVSILIHELGHAIPAKYWKLSPSILLHGLGGLCFHQPADTDNKDLVIVLAGPLLQIFVGALMFGAVALNSIYGTTPHVAIAAFTQSFIYISIIWGLFNLLVPFYPLDGGQTMLLILRRFMKPAKARDLMLKISFTVAIPMVIGALYFGFWILGAFIAWMAWDNLNAIKDGRQLIVRGTGRAQKSAYVTGMMKDVENAFKDEDYREAVRLCHVIRAGGESILEKQQERIWEILVVANVRQSDFDEARVWHRKAPKTKFVNDAFSLIPPKLSE